MKSILIELVRSREHPDAIYCGRGSLFGNPFIMKDDSEAERTRVCKEFELYFNAKVAIGDKEFTEELTKMHDLAVQNRRIKLGCFCTPKRCHIFTVGAGVATKLMKSGYEVFYQVS